ncbi:hypothetical protein AL505_130006 [Escherichia coli]|nr:hypothetical protein AL505_130006 [Escherichia coli]
MEKEEAIAGKTAES